MAIKTSNLNLNLATTAIQKKDASIGSLIDALNTSDNSGSRQDTDASAEIAFTNESTSVRYKALQDNGLNNLRSELIAAVEFLPIGTGLLNEDAARQQFTMGSEGITVNSIARLIELHRQIRSYILKAAQLVLERVYPDVTQESFIKDLRRFIDINFDDLAKLTIDETVENIFKSLQEGRSASKILKDTMESNSENPFFASVD